MKSLGYGKGYSYNPDYKHPVHNVSNPLMGRHVLIQLLKRFHLTQEYLPPELQEHSSFGTESLLQTADEWRSGKGKSWDESKLRDWEWKQNRGDDWSGRTRFSDSENAL